ncbi:hypothetical protein BJ742DRAFT_774080 [Cladochytrium replicatum]|nr:hypothetical protein BJ742DRAFT_774080 [Cladochytrium replicatum]
MSDLHLCRTGTALFASPWLLPSQASWLSFLSWSVMQIVETAEEEETLVSFCSTVVQQTWIERLSVLTRNLAIGPSPRWCSRRRSRRRSSSSSSQQLGDLPFAFLIIVIAFVVVHRRPSSLYSPTPSLLRSAPKQTPNHVPMHPFVTTKSLNLDGQDGCTTVATTLAGLKNPIKLLSSS